MYTFSKTFIIISLCAVVCYATGFSVSAQEAGVDNARSEFPVITDESLDSIKNAGRPATASAEPGEGGDELVDGETDKAAEQESSASTSSAPGWLLVLTICCIIIILCVLVVAIFSILSMSRSRGDVEDAVTKLQDSKSSSSDEPSSELKKELLTSETAVASAVETSTVRDAGSPNSVASDTGDSEIITKDDEGDREIILAPIPSRKVKDLALRRELRFRRAGEAALTAQTATILGEVTKARKNDRMDEAWKWLEELKTREDGAVSYHISKGKLHESAGDWSESEAEYNKAIALDPDRPNGYLRKARLLQKMGRPAESQELYSHIQKKMVA